MAAFIKKPQLRQQLPWARLIPDSYFPADPNHWKLASYAFVSLNSASLLAPSAYDSFCTLPVSLSSLGPLRLFLGEEYNTNDSEVKQEDHSLMASQEPVSVAMEVLHSRTQQIPILTAYNKESPNKVSTLFLVNIVLLSF